MVLLQHVLWCEAPDLAVLKTFIFFRTKQCNKIVDLAIISKTCFDLCFADQTKILL